MTLRVTARLGPALTSLTNRVFLASTLLASLALACAFYFVNDQATAAAESELRRGLAEAGALVDEYQASRRDHVRRLARVIADLPKLKAAVDTGDPPTVEPLALAYRIEADADVLALTSHTGQVLAATGPHVAAVLEAAAGVAPEAEVSLLRPLDAGVLQIVTVPIFLDGTIPYILGRLSMAVLLDDEQARELRRLTGSEIAFIAAGKVRAASMPPEARPAFAAAATTADISTLAVADEEFLALARPLGESAGPVALVLRSRTERLQMLRAIRTRLLGVLGVTLLVATILSYVVARTMTRPLTELTDYVARMEKEAAQKDRLSSLGRMSTVIAHEVRNPLMIIKASLASLRRATVSPADLRDAVADIEGETARLNRIVSEVLDFARPIRFDFAEADVNEICRSCAAAAWAAEGGGPVLDLESSLPLIVTDAERLRTALVNLLANARQAVAANGGQGEVRLATRRGGHHILVTIRDNGPGIAAEDMPHIFDPYFTTRRTGTGLGLPIARNIIEGLQGSIGVSSTPGAGTDIRIELPLAPSGAAV